MRPATAIALVVVIIALILPVFFVDLETPEDSRGSAPNEPSANAPHPHLAPPEMQRELDRIRRENKPVTPPRGNEIEPPPANHPMANEPVN